MKEELKNKLILTGNDFSNVDFIFNNNIFKVDPKYSKRYSIPRNYKKYSEIKKGEVLINEFYGKE